MFKVNDKNTKTDVVLVFLYDFEHISQLFQVFLLLAGYRVLAESFKDYKSIFSRFSNLKESCTIESYDNI